MSRISSHSNSQQKMYSSILFFLLSIVDARDAVVEQNVDTEPKPPVAFAFGPGGLLFPYYVGVAYELRDLGLLHSWTPIAGSSAGSIVASAIAFGIDEDEVLRQMGIFMSEIRKGVKLKDAFRKILEVIVPEDAPERAHRHGLQIAYLEVWPNPQPHVVSHWESKEDIIETILASCNFPFYFSTWPLVKCRDSWAIDGMFAVGEKRFGCPRLPADRTVAVIAGPNVENSFNVSDIIEPEQPGLELPENVREEWAWWTIYPAADEQLRQMTAVGKEHARKWAQAQPNLKEMKNWRPPLKDLKRLLRWPKRQPQPQVQQPASQKEAEEPKLALWPSLRRPQAQQPAPQQREAEQPKPLLWSGLWKPQQLAQPLAQVRPLPQMRHALSQRVEQLHPMLSFRLMSYGHAASDRLGIPAAVLLGLLVGVGVLCALLRFRRGALTVGEELLLPA
eukprot:gnl/TRDRNA2_/TRDRNA2_167853_c1_seq7.p1 gnl/TRDRNA2_/TRDRNA2_167853_c1~~gnl/TRDRNA2_/TRDRNA2_167853_c1_seq7.p1  ORF type:complete len:448 (+),score=77.84 gnl/TRDRNA2_/TRDRNA2_167853_c1_seq7:58-1401(+)